MVSYCETRDLLLGGVNVPTFIDPVQYINAASEEVDVALSGVYSTPFTMAENSQTRPTILFLKQVTSKLASGRIIMAAAAGAEMSEVHQYGIYLVTQAIESLKQVASGEFILPGATPVDPSPADTGGVRIKNVDATSNVEDFYTQLQKQTVPVPYLLGGYPYGY